MLSKIISKYLPKLLFGLSVLAIVVLILDYGYQLTNIIQQEILVFYTILLSLGIFSTVGKYLFEKKKVIPKVFTFDVISIVFILFCIYKQYTFSSIHPTDWIRYAVILKVIRELATPRINYKRSVLNPAQLFIVSFIFLILLGAFMLMLPNATYGGLSFIDALFTSTSAVCVTGLSVVNVNETFTQLGQTVLLLLIQAGGLGILTFASYFSYFFKGGASFENQLALSDITSPGKIGDVFSTIKYILSITFIVEIIGAIFIFFSVDTAVMPNILDRLFFAIFHAISAFCNAGFSNLPDGMMQAGFVNNYYLQLCLICLFIFGGLGFPIVINVLRYVKYIIKRYFLWFFFKEVSCKPWVLTLSSKINLMTTGFLVAFGTIILLIKEYNHSFANHDGWGKIVTALFTATTPRTAGFNTIDFGNLHFSSIIIIIFLMWVGASPASTGGGIKTSTFAIATLNFINLAKGKNNIEVFRREIADISVRRAFATMTLSLVVIGFGVLAIAHFEHRFSLLQIIFESFSAYSTVGLTIGITGDLADPSKLVLISMMFIGRVTMLTIMIAFFKQVRKLNYHYPTDEIMIN